MQYGESCRPLLLLHLPLERRGQLIIILGLLLIKRLPRARGLRHAVRVRLQVGLQILPRHRQPLHGRVRLRFHRLLGHLEDDRRIVAALVTLALLTRARFGQRCDADAFHFGVGGGCFVFILKCAELIVWRFGGLQWLGQRYEVRLCVARERGWIYSIDGIGTLYSMIREGRHRMSRLREPLNAIVVDLTAAWMLQRQPKQI